MQQLDTALLLKYEIFRRLVLQVTAIYCFQKECHRRKLQGEILASPLTSPSLGL